MLKIRRSNDRLILNVGIPYTWEWRSLYWDGAQDARFQSQHEPILGFTTVHACISILCELIFDGLVV